MFPSKSGKDTKCYLFFLNTKGYIMYYNDFVLRMRKNVLKGCPRKIANSLSI